MEKSWKWEAAIKVMSDEIEVDSIDYIVARFGSLEVHMKDGRIVLFEYGGEIGNE